VRRFFAELLSRHDWLESGSIRRCAVCGRMEREELEVDEFQETLQWVTKIDGDILKHWPRVPSRRQAGGQ